MYEISDKYITKIRQLGERYTKDDGLGLWKNKVSYHIHDCIIDMSNCDDIDEAFAVTYGSSAVIENCIIRNAPKLVLIGSGDKKEADNEYGKEVHFYNCILESCGRRCPEVQAGMKVTMQNCLIKNWGSPDYFDVRNFGAWSHDDGSITATNCIFWQDEYARPIKQTILDICNHVGQEINDIGIKALFRASSYKRGVCRGLTANDSGTVYSVHCYANQEWIDIGDNINPMTQEEAEKLLVKLGKMSTELSLKLIRS